MELELWGTYCWDNRKRFSEILGRKFAFELPQKLGMGQVRIDTANTEIFTELWMPIGEEMTVGKVEELARALNEEFAAIWQRTHEVASGVEPPIAYLKDKPSHSVFICHSTLDKPFVRRLCEELKKQQLRVWLDEEQILVGHDFVAKMEEGITASDFTAVVLSPRFVAHGPWAKEEYRSALSRQVAANRVVLLPVLMESCDIPPLLTSKKYADFTGTFEEGFRTLAFSIANHNR